MHDSSGTTSGHGRKRLHTRHGAVDADVGTPGLTGQAADAPRGNPADRQDALSRRVFQVTAIVLGVLGIFGVGIHFAQAKYWPYKPIADAWKILEEAVEYRTFAPDNALGDAPSNASREPFVAHVPEAVAPGYRAVMGYLSSRQDFGIWLFDSAGNRVHERLLNYRIQDPDGPSGGSEAPHAFHFLSDGSVVVNTDKGDVMTRYDTCGEPVWTRDGAFHHSFAPDPRGGLWTWRGEMSAFDQYQFLVRIDPVTGETLEEISLVDDIIMASAGNQAIFTVVSGYELKHAERYRAINDLFHPNDLEVLQPGMAAAFPEFDAGDLLMSFRNIDLVIVVDAESFEIKWWSHGPWIQQHDPDFNANGEITVFNNNGWRSLSNIVGIDPSTRELREVPVDPAHRFYTQYMGKHNLLDDGTLQVVVPFEGRVLEFDSAGELILEINNLHSTRHNAFVADLALLREDFFDIPPENFGCASVSHSGAAEDKRA